jgi:PAS domain S-box-containing protein
MGQDKTLRILLVEDNAGDARLVLELLRGITNVELEWVESLSAALGHLEQNFADIVLLDLGLPDSQGLDSVNRLTNRMPALPIIVLTGLGDDELALEALKAGAQDYMVKGLVETDMLMRSIRYSMGRKMAEVALRESDERYRITLEGMIDAVSIQVIHDARYLYVNKAFCDLTGYPAEEVVGKTPFDLNLPLDPENHDDYLQGILERAPGRRLEVTYRMRDGSTLHALLSCTPVEYRGEHCAVVVMTDITALKASEEAKKKLEIQLAQTRKMDALGTLAGGFAHDFNNILTAIVGFTELAMMSSATPEKVQKYLDNALKSGRRAKELLSQILAFSRHGLGRYVPISLSYPIKESLDRIRSMIPANIEIRQNISASHKVMADPTQMNQILMNLSLNAAQSMEATGGKLDVGLDEVVLDLDNLDLNLPQGSYLRLVISDTGPGIPPDIMDHIFEPYFTTKRQGEGSGMGLAVVHGIVKRHGGGISCRSTPGKGTTVEIYLPEAKSREEREDPQAGVVMPAGTERILFVDDEPALVGLAQNLFESLGYQVTALVSSTEALDLFRKDPQRFDIVVTDMNMPGMMGDELAREMMKIRPDLPVILYTGYSEFLSEEKAASLGIREFVLKPFAMREMAGIIRRVLDGRDKAPGDSSNTLHRNC